ncbi:MAG: alkaline phosphatase [Cetobacterium sp.]|uniref:alkaline phosphatase n=1 Tax=Cetobacterium sp. TaxID=2071632 RepID=UPI003F3F7E0D
MKRLSKTALVFLATGVSAFSSVKNVIYFIGDGLGPSQRQITEYYKTEVLGQDGKLAMNSMPALGITTTHAADTLITDSAAAGTALATGFKTNNGMISMLPSGEKLKSLTDIAKNKDMKTGIITSTRLTHATPAVFVTTNSSRANEAEMAEDFVKANIDFYAGGGYRFFVPKTGEFKSSRKDEKNVVKDLENNGYKTFIGEGSSKNLLSYTPKSNEKVFAALTNSHLPYEIDRVKDNSTPSLAELTRKGIEVLSKENNKGFFLMVEGGRIDHASHAQDAVGTIMDTIAFDDAINVALEFYKNDPENTLIVVAADHETGGMGLGYGNNYSLNLEALKNIKLSVEDKLQKAYKGNKEEYFSYLDKELGLNNLTVVEKESIEKAIKAEDNKDTTAINNSYGGYAPTAISVAHIISQRAGLQWTSFAHTATQVPLSATGKTSENFVGFKDNTDVAKEIANSMGGKL